MQQRNATKDGVVMGDKTIRETKERILIMAVLVEAISIVCRLETIAEKYPGGLEQYIKDCPNQSLCMDKEIVRVGFMTTIDAKAFVDNLENLGFTLVTDGQFDEIALVDQFEGFALPCDWLNFSNLVLFEGDIRVKVCRSTGKPLSEDEIVFPRGWDYETSLSKRTSILDSNYIDKHMIFLHREHGVDFYLDAITGEERWIERSARRDTDA